MAEKKQYTVGKWKDKRKYTCKICGWSCLDNVDKMKAHIEENHTKKPKKEPLQVPIYDRFGKLVKYKEAK